MVHRRFFRPSFDAGVLLLLIAGLFAANQVGLVHLLDDRLAELRFEVRPREPSSDIVLVDIDARSLAEIGVWPWPRTLHGELVEAAARAGAARIAFDVDFSNASSPPADQAFAEALAASGSETFLAAFVQQDTAGGTAVRPSMPIEPLLQNSWPVAVNVSVDGDGRVRTFPFSVQLGEERLASMPSVLADREAADGSFGIDYSISPRGLPRISYVDLLRGRADPKSLAGKTLIVGATALELHDLFAVPVHGIVSGSTVIALATETLRQGRALQFLSTPPLVLAAIGVVLLLAARRLRPGRLLALLAAAMVATEAVAVLLQDGSSLVLATANLHILLCCVLVWTLAREFDLRRMLLWIARTQSGNHRNILERVIDDGFEGVVILDDRGKVARINREAEKLVGLSRVERLEDLPPPIVGDVRTVLDAFRRGEPVAGHGLGDLRLTIAGIEHVLEYRVAPFWMTPTDHPGTRPAADAAYACITMRDVTERELAQDRMRFLALHDGLTGLGNRSALEQELATVLTDAGSDTGMALLCFDLQRFKAFNDGLGHSIGDQVLIETAGRARDTLSGALLLARIGGDEFAALLPAPSPGAAAALAERLVGAVAQPYHVGGHRLSIATCVGIGWWAGGRATATSAMRHADVALNRAKRSSAGQVVIFQPFMDDDRLARLEIEQDLNQAIEQGQFDVVYQPQVRLSSGAFVGAEALVRWTHPVRGSVSPVRFIPVLEEMGLIHRLGAWVLAEACREAAAWPEPLKVAVNVSALQFETGDLVGAVRRALETSGLSAERLELEITESAFAGESEGLKIVFDDLLALGVSFALDDFGTGYSSLGYLHRFPISKIKIDRSFVTDIPGSGHSMAVLRSIRSLADGLGIRTIAEGIETERQAEALRILGCQDGQGYLFSKPVGPAAARRIFAGDMLEIETTERRSSAF